MVAKRSSGDRQRGGTSTCSLRIVHYRDSDVALKMPMNACLPRNIAGAILKRQMYHQMVTGGIELKSGGGAVDEIRVS